MTLISVYFPFFGRFFPEIYNMSGQPENVKKYGPWFDYHQNPRAQIFKRDQGKVNDLNTLIKLMRLVFSSVTVNTSTRRKILRTYTTS